MSNLESIIASYVLPEETSGTYQITMNDGEPITCRRVVSYRDIADYKAGLTEFWKRCQTLDLAPNALEFAPKSYDEARVAFTLMYSACEPTPINEREALMLLRAPWVMEHLIGQIDARQAFDVVEARRLALERAKKDTKGTDGDGPDSSNPGTASDDTPES